LSKYVFLQFGKTSLVVQLLDSSSDTGAVLVYNANHVMWDTHYVY